MLASEVLYSVEMGLLLLAACILLGPVIAERVRVPGLVGLIAIGMVLGPYVLEWLRPSGFVATVGAAGLLYLMFLAGVELDLKTFVENRTAAVTFGLLTFAIPFALSFAVGRWHLDHAANGAALIGAMWASHTLVAYPEAKAAGLDRNRAVGVAVAATVITDVLALVVLAVAASSNAIEGDVGARASTPHPPLPLWAGLVLTVVFCLGVLPRLTRWVFAHVVHSRTQRFVWLLAGMAAGAVCGLLGGIEGLVGAFLAGIGMNRSVPAKGELMEHVEFFGNSLLVPAFLVAVGLSIDPAAIVDPATLRLAGIFVALVVIGKTLPALIAGRLFGFSIAETAIMATLTIGQAAATLAIAQVGVATGIFDQEILNAAVVTVVVTVLITSFGTRLAARSVDRPPTAIGALGEHIVAWAPEPEAAQQVALLASALAKSDAGLVTPFVSETSTVDDAAARLSPFATALTQLGHDVHGVVRAAERASAAALGIARETAATLLVVPAESRTFPFGVAFEDELDEIGAASPVPVVAVRMVAAPWRRLVVITGAAAGGPAAVDDLRLVADVVGRLRDARDVDVVVFAASPNDAVVFGNLDNVEVRSYSPRAGRVTGELEAGDLLVVPAQVVADAGVLARAKLRGALAEVSVVVVGGPGRVRVSIERRRRLLGVVGASR